jgi:hypothetical protein
MCVLLFLQLLQIFLCFSGSTIIGAFLIFSKPHTEFLRAINKKDGMGNNFRLKLDLPKLESATSDKIKSTMQLGNGH